MLIFAVDDEPKMLKLLHKAIEEAAPDAEIMDFSFGTDALASIRDNGFLPDIVFSDIRMPKLDGVEFAVRVKNLAPFTKIVFVTGFDDYAVKAFRIHASGYIMKPVDSDRIREEINNIREERNNALLFAGNRDGRLKVQCLGRFEVFWDNHPLQFNRLQTKELFAYLIDINGAQCTTVEAASAIWEDEADVKVLSHRIRNLIADLRTTLDSIGQGNVLVRKGKTLSINRDLIDCDYYQMLSGSMEAVNSYRGEYMTQYSWATLTEGNLYFRLKK